MDQGDVSAGIPISGHPPAVYKIWLIWLYNIIATKYMLMSSTYYTVPNVSRIKLSRGVAPRLSMVAASMQDR